MPPACCIVGCRNTRCSKGIRLFQFPAANKRYCAEFQNILAARRKAWINATKRKSLSDGNIDKLKICSEHFISGKPANFRDTLHPDWIPSIRIGCKKYSDKLHPEKRLERYARALVRNQKRTDLTPEVPSNTKSVEETQNNSEVAITSASDGETDTASCHSLDISDFSNDSESTAVPQIEADVDIVVVSPNDTNVPDSNLNNLRPPVALLENPRSEEISPVGKIQLLQLEIVSLTAQLVLQKDEIEKKDKEISSLKEQTASLISELNNRCSEVYDLRLKLKRFENNQDAFVNSDE